MNGVAAEDLLLATLRTDSSERSVVLSGVVERLSGSGQRLSRQVEVAVAVERLVEQGLVSRESGERGELLELTAAGQSRAASVVDRLADREIELVRDGQRRTVTVGEAARRLDRSVVGVATDCSGDDVYYDQQRVEADGLVNREAERSQFSDLLERVDRTGSGETVRFLGPGGSGKTSLVTTVLAETSPSVDVVTTHCRGLGNAPYQPVQDALAAVGADDLFDAARFEADDNETYEAQQTGLFSEITAQLTPDDGSRVLFFDDVDHADPATWSYLDFLCRRVADHPLVVVLAHRPGTVPEDAPIHLDDAPESTCIEVGGLDRESTAHLVEQTLGRRGVPEAFVDAVYQRTGGTPLYVETTVETLVETNQLDPQLQWYPTDPAEFDLPDAVRETITRQVTMLEPDVRNVLEWAAVARGFVPVSLLQTAADPAPERVATILETVGMTGMLRRSSRDGETHVSFRNDVFGEALVATLSAAQLQQHHATVARLLEERTETHALGSRREAADRAATVAFHYENGGDAAAAVEWYQTAADRATDVYAHETAIEHCYRVVDVAREAGDSNAVLAANERLVEVYTVLGAYDKARKHLEFVRERTDSEDVARRQRLARLAGRIHNALGEYDAAIEAASSALEAGHQSTAEQCRLLDVLATAHEGKSNHERVMETAERHRELAAEIEKPRLEADAVHRLGQVERHRSSYAAAHDYFEESLDVYRAVDDRRGEARSLNNLGIVAFRRDEHDRAREYHEASLEIKREIGDRRGEANNLINLGNIALVNGEYDRASEYYEGSLEIKRDIGDRRGAGQNLNNLGVIAFKRGDYDRAREYYEESRDVYQAIGYRRGETASLNNLGLVAFRRGDYERAREYYEGSLSVSREIGDRHGEAESVHNLGEIAAVCGDSDLARERFEESLSTRREIGDRRGEADCLASLGALARWRSDGERARDHYERSRELAERLGDAALEARSHRGLCALARKRGDDDTAQEHADRGLDMLDERTHPVELGRMRVEAGRLALARGDAETARQRARQAFERFEQSDEPLWRARSERLLGDVACESGDPSTAREHWRNAVETFRTLGSHADTVRTLDRLVSACREAGDDQHAQSWYRTALSVRDEATDPLVDEHAAWLDGVSLLGESSSD